jgi:protein involved in polysaccharide export with SLBB domain
MDKFITLPAFLTFLFVVQGCSQVLEPVSLSLMKSDLSYESVQEEFSINIEGLTFENALKANQDPYRRKIMSTGTGPNANVINESDLLNLKAPKLSGKIEYQLGVGDILSFVQMNEFKYNESKLPFYTNSDEYLLGVGDELTFIQVNETINPTDTKMIQKDFGLNTVIETKGNIGTDGNILLLGVGNINANNRSLTDVRSEVRNILIRNGLVPKFQLEITKYLSKKVHIVVNDAENDQDINSQIILLNSIPITLQEIALNAGVTSSSKNTLISLNRDRQIFRINAKYLFDLETPDVIIKDKDQIEIEIKANESKMEQKRVGSRGFILLDGVGRIDVLNKSLSTVREEIHNKLLLSGINPNFQLELLESKSRKVYLNSHTFSLSIPLTNEGIHLKDLILDNIQTSTTDSDSQLSIITLRRKGKTYRMAKEQLFSQKDLMIWMQDLDQVEYQTFKYKPGQVFALIGSQNAKILEIDPSKRETLADILFVDGGALENINAKRSDVYLLRGQNPSKAYHLDAQNVSRILVAAKTELRPNDILFVAERPIISFSRTLSEIAPLRILLRDIKDNNFP